MCVLKFLKNFESYLGRRLLCCLTKLFLAVPKLLLRACLAFFPSIMSSNVFMPISLRWGKMCLFPNSALFRKKPLNFCIFDPCPFL